MFKFSKASNERKAEVDYRLQQIANLAITLTAVDFGIPPYGGMRTTEEQYKLYTEGKSRADGTHKLSYHQSGKALDFYAYVDGKASWHPGHLAMVAAAMLQASAQLGYKLTWGGLWQPIKITNSVPHGWDAGHVQLEE